MSTQLKTRIPLDEQALALVIESIGRDCCGDLNEHVIVANLRERDFLELKRGSNLDQPYRFHRTASLKPLIFAIRWPS